MRFDRLLTCSAAMMMTISGAKAADAVFAAEPEPMEYVKVCDVYGTGFFYIPGTETCLKFSGYLRSEFIYTDTAATEETDWRYRARVNFDARNETEWGTLRARLRVEGNGRGGADANATIDHAMISLGGVRLGYGDLWFNTFHGDGWQYAANDGYYDDDQAVMLDYTFAANGFSAVIGVQDLTSVTAVPANSDPYDAYTGIAYEGSWGKIAGSVVYDTSADELAWKASLDVNAIQNIGIHAWYQADEGGTVYVTGGTGTTLPEWEWGVDVAYTITSKFIVWAGYTDADFNNAGRYGLGARWKPFSGLSFRPEAVFGDDYTQVRMRVVRSF